MPDPNGSKVVIAIATIAGAVAAIVVQAIIAIAKIVAGGN